MFLFFLRGIIQKMDYFLVKSDELSIVLLCFVNILIFESMIREHIGHGSVIYVLLVGTWTSCSVSLHMEVSCNRATPSHHTFLDGIFH